jgi:hypothetical protein
MTPTASIDILSSVKISKVELKEIENKKIIDEIKRLEEELKNIKGTKCEVWSRCVGYFRPVKDWNPGKQEEFKERESFKI